MRIVYMGTPDFAVPALENLIDAGHQVVGVITQPDKPKGRGKAMQYSPVKEKALSYGIEVYQPVKVNEPEMLQTLRELNPDVIVVAAFGQVLKSELLHLPRYGCINIHASLLPRFRGAAPIQWAVIEGDKEAGVTTMYMEEGLDTGDMLLQAKIVLDAKETGGSLFDKLSKLGGKLIVETLEQLETGTLSRTPQTGESTYAGMLTKSSGHIDWTQDAVKLERLIRGLNPWPSAYTRWNGKMLKIWSANVDESLSGNPGTIIAVNKENFVVATGKGALVITEVQAEGKKRMAADAWLRGIHLNTGDKFDE
jgi:methionyl-tRNA formyltransferase